MPWLWLPRSRAIASLVAVGREAVGLTVGIPKRQADKQSQPKDDLDSLMDQLDALGSMIGPSPMQFEAPLSSDEFPARLENAYQIALAALLAERRPEGHWTGELSTSALSTATAVSATGDGAKKDGDSRRSCDASLPTGLAWLAKHQNADGGWGDTSAV